jgi:carbon-monoxide dehydrogenase medium subunit
MIATAFDYSAPKSVDEALALLAKHGDEAKVLAGGHSLLPMMKLRLAAPSFVVDIGRINALRGIRETAGHVEIGALTTHAEVETSDLLKRVCPLLPATAAEIGDVQVRNRGTIGGSLSHFDPAADYPAAILALEAEIVAQSRQGERTIAAADFFTDTFQTALQPGELLTKVRVPVSGAGAGSAYVKVHHPASGYAVVGVAAMVTLDGRRTIHRVRVAITGLGPKAFRATAVERDLEGKHPEAAAIRAAAQHAAEGIAPLSDLYASAEYRAELARVHCRRALEKALQRAKG